VTELSTVKNEDQQRQEAETPNAKRQAFKCVEFRVFDWGVGV
jgi:hypothetical protein